MIADTNPFKIALVGASCSGKTTLFENCRKYYADRNDFLFVEESARPYIKEQWAKDPNTNIFTLDFQKTIQDRTLENEKNAHSKSPSVIICDSTVIDQVVYTKVSGEKMGAEELFNRIVRWLPSYNIFLMCDPNEVPYVTDGERTMTPQQRMMLHDTFNELLQEKNIPFLMISGNPQQRVEKVHQILRTKNIFQS